MSQTLNAAIAVIGIDIGKNSFTLLALMTAAPEERGLETPQQFEDG